MRRLTLVAAFALLAAAQVPAPETPAGRRFSHWLEVFNRGNRDELKQLLETAFVKPRSLDDVVGFRQQTGGFKLETIEESGATRVVGVVQERADADHRARFTMEVEPAEPHRIANISIELIPPGDMAPPGPTLSEAEAIDSVRVELNKRASENKFSGVVLIAKHGKPLFTGAYGMANREKKIANRLDTQFRLGSMNKMFTATAAMQLVAAGKLGLNDPIGKYLPGYPNRDIASKVTVHHLLTHTGGTGDFFGPEYEANRLKLRELKDYIALFGTRGPRFEPGAKFEYSNYGFILLGVLIERASGQSYYTYVREHVFKPAGMMHTESLPESTVVANRSIGYMKADGGVKPNTDTLPYRGTSAGGGYSTVEDLSRFATAILTHKVLNERDTATLTTGKVAMGPRAKYAYGFGDTIHDGVREFGHNGGAPGMNGDLKIFPESGYVIAVLANMDPPAAGRVAEFIASRLPVK